MCVTNKLVNQSVSVARSTSFMVTFGRIYISFGGLRVLYKATDYLKTTENQFYQYGLISIKQKSATCHELHIQLPYYGRL
jgi:hypothetical protein